MTGKELQDVIRKTGRQILTVCDNGTTSFPEAVLAGKIKITLDFKNVDRLYFSLLEVQKIIDGNHDRECLRLRKLIQGYLDRAFDFNKFDKEV